MRDALSVAAACIAFALIHSVMVADSAKRALARTLGASLMRRHYRLAFTIISIASTIAVIYIIYMTPDLYIWSAPLWLSIVMQAIRASALIFAALSFRGFSLAEFTGIRQALRESPEGNIEGMSTSDVLITDGGYAVVRNPLYFAGIVIVSLDPTITRNGLIVSALADAYFVFGAFMEQSRMLERFGQSYIDYMKRVPLLLPDPILLVRFVLGLDR